MVQGYYSLEEAAKILGMGADELSQLAQKREVRAFADRGTWRFRTQDVEELARRRGQGSSPDLPIIDAPGKAPADIFNFPLSGESDQVEIGQEMLTDSPSSARKGTGSKARTPTPKAGSDSDVRLVAEGGGVSFRLSDSKVTGPGSGARVGPGSGPKAGPGSGPKSGPRKAGSKPASDSDVKIVGDASEDVALGGKPSRTGSDSDVRLDLRSAKAKGPDDSFLTEEIDLDAEIKKAEKAGSGDKHRPTPSGTAPFELSESDLALPQKKPGQSHSSDFDLSLDVSGDLSPLEPTSDEMPALKSKKRSEEVPLGQRPKGVSESDSGISLAKPADGGVSLEKKKRSKDSSDEISFEIAREPGTTPKPQKTSAEDSSSEFELTLEDSARLAPEEEGGKDIFETDFEVPALEDSGSGAVKLDDSDTDLESSDFDLALGDEDVAAEEESGSQVVALEDEESVDEGAATIARPAKLSPKGKKKPVDDDEAELISSEEDEEIVAVPRGAAAAPAVAADWGVLTPTVLIFSVIVMFLVSVMGFELVRGMWGYRQPNKVSSLLIRSIGGLFYDTKDLDVD
ncbi:MAG TPA: helix-turn-helix domain-containing protein [Gemmataceae bacterium]|jgi:excisionase family DNA binding protein|nr:helix-turn-helix domain-containing protein [Gemmataceae bacterium]